MIHSPDVSVVLRTYTEERWDSLITAIEALQNQTKPPAEIVLVVDHNPLLLERVRATFPNVVVVENYHARGSPGAWNSGIAATKNEIVAFTDDDAVAAPNWLERLVLHYESPAVFGVGGTIEPIWEKGRPVWFPDEFDWVVGCTYRGLPSRAASVRNLIGCNMSFRRQVFDAVGGFLEGMGRVGGDDQVLAGLTSMRTSKPAYIHGCDETELCIRFRQHWSSGLLIYEPLARVYHQVPQNRSTWDYFIARCYLEGVSKALLSRLRGRKDSLASEQIQAFQVLPQGVVRSVREAFTHRDRVRLTRAWAIIIGLAVTATGYLMSSVRSQIGNPGGEGRLVQS